MAAKLDELIQSLLFDVATAGDDGLGFRGLTRATQNFYKSRAKQVTPSSANQADLLFSQAPPQATPTVDDKFVESVWDWLSACPDVEIRKAQAPEPDLNDQDEPSSDSPSLAPAKYADLRIHAAEEHVWHAIAGHEIDHQRISPLEFECLRVIASHGSHGCLQPEVTRVTGQDKRSVPKRTDVLLAKGYITKEAVISVGVRTSKLTLKKHSQEAMRSAVETHPSNSDQKIVFSECWFHDTVRLLRENGGMIALDDLRTALGINGLRWETKIFRRCWDRLVDAGLFRKVRAQTQGSGKFVRCLQLAREPKPFDKHIFTATKERKLDLDMDVAKENDDEDAAADGDDDPENATSRIPSQWTPDLPYPNHVFKLVDGAGVQGVGTTEVHARIAGSHWKRPMDEVLLRLTQDQTSQPQNLQHLSIVRDTEQSGRTSAYRYRSRENFVKAVEAGDTAWEAVHFGRKPPGVRSKPKKVKAANKLDEWGFPLPDTKQFPDGGLASLQDCRQILEAEMRGAGKFDRRIARKIGRYEPPTKAQPSNPKKRTSRRSAPDTGRPAADGRADPAGTSPEEAIEASEDAEARKSVAEKREEANYKALANGRALALAQAEAARIGTSASAERIQQIEQDILARTGPGIYINPPGSKKPWIAQLGLIGRPPKHCLIVFKSEGLRALPWFSQRDSVRGSRRLSLDSSDAESADGTPSPREEVLGKRKRSSTEDDLLAVTADAPEQVVASEIVPHDSRRRLIVLNDGPTDAADNVACSLETVNKGSHTGHGEPSGAGAGATIASQTSPLASISDRDLSPPKKRGRPSKAMIAERERQRLGGTLHSGQLHGTGLDKANADLHTSQLSPSMATESENPTQSSPPVPVSSGALQLPKKRGRPTKAMVAERQRRRLEEVANAGATNGSDGHPMEGVVFTSLAASGQPSAFASSAAENAAGVVPDAEVDLPLASHSLASEHLPEDALAASSAEGQDDTHDPAQQPSAQDEPVRRKRGRPRKTPAASDVTELQDGHSGSTILATQDEGLAPPVRRPRGRPRKTPAAPVLAGEDQSMQAALPFTDASHAQDRTNGGVSMHAVEVVASARQQQQHQSPFPAPQTSDQASAIDSSLAMLPELVPVGETGLQGTNTPSNHPRPTVVRMQREKIVMDIVRQCAGAFPGGRAMWRPFRVVWSQQHHHLPDRQTVERTIASLVEVGRLKKMKFTFHKKKSQVTLFVLLEPGTQPDTPHVRAMQKAMIDAHPRLYSPIDGTTSAADEVPDKEDDQDTVSYSAYYKDNFQSVSNMTVKRMASENGTAEFQTLHLNGGNLRPIAPRLGLTPNPNRDGSSGIDPAPLPRDLDDMLSRTDNVRSALARHKSADPDKTFFKTVDRVHRWEVDMNKQGMQMRKERPWSFINLSMAKDHVRSEEDHLQGDPLNFQPLEDPAEPDSPRYTAQSSTKTAKPRTARETVQQADQDGPSSRPKRPYKSRKRVVEVVEDESPPPPTKRRRRRTTQQDQSLRIASGRLVDQDYDHLLIAMALGRLLCNWPNRGHFPWIFIQHAMGFRFDVKRLKHSWNSAKRRRDGEEAVSLAQKALQEPLLAAYSSGDLPHIDFAHPQLTDWPALVQWAEKRILPLEKPVGKLKPRRSFNLPDDRTAFEAKYKTSLSLNNTDYDPAVYFDDSRDYVRAQTSNNHPWGLPVHNKSPPSASQDDSELDQHLILVKSIARAIAITPEKTYNSAKAVARLNAVGHGVINQACDELNKSETFSRLKSGRCKPGRNFYIHRTTIQQFSRWQCHDNEADFFKRVTTARIQYAEHFRQHAELPFSAEATEAENLVLTNMLSQGHLEVTPSRLERHDDPNAMPPKLSIWGWREELNTKRGHTLKFPLKYVRCAAFTHTDGLRRGVPVPLQAAHLFPDEPAARVPFWVDVHGRVVPAVWDMVLRSVVHLLVFRPGLTARAIEVAHKAKLWTWEVELLLAWMEVVGLAVRAGPAGDGEQQGWTASPWWYCAFLPGVAAW